MVGKSLSTQLKSNATPVLAAGVCRVESRSFTQGLSEVWSGILGPHNHDLCTRQIAD